MERWCVPALFDSGPPLSRPNEFSVVLSVLLKPPVCIQSVLLQELKKQIWEVQMPDWEGGQKELNV
jgi:hypothetical protein